MKSLAKCGIGELRASRAVPTRGQLGDVDRTGLAAAQPASVPAGRAAAAAAAAAGNVDYFLRARSVSLVIVRLYV